MPSRRHGRWATSPRTATTTPQDAQGKMESRIRQLQALLKTARVVEGVQAATAR